VGRNVVFWSPVPGQTGTTGSLIAVAAMLGLEYASRSLVCHFQGRRSALEQVFGNSRGHTEHASSYFTDTGIDALERLGRNHKLTPEIIRDYTIPVLKDRLDLLPGTLKPNRAFVTGIKEVVHPMLETTKRYYDLTLFDGGSGTRQALTQALLQNADLVVVSLNQNPSVLERFFMQKEAAEWLAGKPLLLLLGQYDRYSASTARNIARRYKQKTLIYNVPHNAGFMDAMQAGRTIDFFFRNRRVSKDHENFVLMQEVRSLTQAINAQTGLNKLFFGGKGES
jgi:hypothetical protein